MSLMTASDMQAAGCALVGPAMDRLGCHAWEAAMLASVVFSGMSIFAKVLGKSIYHSWKVALLR